MQSLPCDSGPSQNLHFIKSGRSSHKANGVEMLKRANVRWEDNAPLQFTKQVEMRLTS